MSRWVRVVSANDGLHQAERAVYRFLVRGNQRTGAYAFVVQAKVLRVGAGNQQLFMQRSESAQAFRVFFQTAGKALIGEVKQRQPAFLYRQLRQLLPLLKRRIDTGRVVAAAVEQHHVAGLGFVQAGQQTVEVEFVVSGVVIGIFANFQAG